MKRVLIEIIDRLDEVDDSDRFNPPSIYAEGGSRAEATARALICASDEAGGLACLQDRTLSYVLKVQLAKEAMEVWSSWRAGKVPSPRNKFDAVMFYSRHDAYLRVETGL
jgi:hypothetical protein